MVAKRPRPLRYEAEACQVLVQMWEGRARAWCRCGRRAVLQLVNALFRLALGPELAKLDPARLIPIKEELGVRRSRPALRCPKASQRWRHICAGTGHMRAGT
jgi:hypothetical protein